MGNLRHSISALSSTLAVTLAFSTTACLEANSGAEPATIGPFDGTYVLRSRTCNGTNLVVRASNTRYVVKGGTATLSETLPDNCLITRVSALAYTAPGTVVSTLQRTTCNVTCSGAECTPTGPQEPQTFTYSASNPSLILNSNAESTSSACSGGNESIAFSKGL